MKPMGPVERAGAPPPDRPRTLNRRSVLGLAIGWLLAPRGAAGETDSRKAGFTARASLLYGVLRFEESGTIHETIDRAAGRYEVRITGQGPQMTTEIESSGILLDGRWAPVRFQDRFGVYGRQSRLEITYDYTRRVIRYQGRSETFVLRRVRVTDDTLALPAGTHVDDVVSAALNHAEGRWPPEPDGTLVTRVIRRQRGQKEGPDDVERRYRAELVPFALRVGPAADGRSSALMDLTRFSSWAREDEPARIVFGADRRPETVTATLILGTSLAIRIGPEPARAS